MLIPFHIVFLSILNWYLVKGLILEEPLPNVLKTCLNHTAERNSSRMSQVDVHRHCLNNIHTKKESDFISQDDINFLNSILDEMMSKKRRVKRQTADLPVRREVRNLTEAEWNNFVDAIQTLKRDGTYDRLAAIHRGVFNLRSAHRGPNFFGWHRIYLLVLEWSLQRVRPGVTIPYWDCTMDFDTTNPTRSVVWTRRFFGNGNGIVTSGPFANWSTGQNQRLVRNIGSGGTLITKAAIDLVLSRNTHEEIIDRNNVLYYLEGYHDGPHVWVDGMMRVLETASEDPVFYFHHCFIDYLWELFRRRQQERGISSENDYPNVPGLHAPNRRMAGFTRLRNVQGYLNYWTDTFYTYAPSPSCTATEDSCYSSYLTCDVTRERCVTTEGEFPFAAVLGSQFSAAGAFRSAAPGIIRVPPSDERLASRQRLFLPAGEMFESVFVDRRSRDDGLPQVFSRVRRSNSQVMNDRQKRSFYQSKLKYKMPRKWSSEKGASMEQNNDSLYDFKHSADAIYIPINIISYQPFAPKLESLVTRNGEIFNKFVSSERNQFSRNLRKGTTVAFVQSDGIDYNGRYKDVAITNIEHIISSSFSYIAVKNPRNESVTAIISVYDNFGRICTPVCLVHKNFASKYRPCSGAIKVTSEIPTMYSLTYEESIESVWNMTNILNPIVTNENIFMKFVCKDKA